MDHEQHTTDCAQKTRASDINPFATLQIEAFAALQERARANFEADVAAFVETETSRAMEIIDTYRSYGVHLVPYYGEVCRFVFDRSRYPDGIDTDIRAEIRGSGILRDDLFRIACDLHPAIAAEQAHNRGPRWSAPDR